MTENDAFFLSLATMGFAFLSLIIRYCYKSKCEDIKIGCIKIHRNVDDEMKGDSNINHNTSIEI